MTENANQAPASLEDPATAGPQAVDPGLADQTPGGPPERPAWSQNAAVPGPVVDGAPHSAGRPDVDMLRERMHGEWTRSEPDTEQLRLLLRGYRSLFNRLLDSGF